MIIIMGTSRSIEASSSESPACLDHAVGKPCQVVVPLLLASSSEKSVRRPVH